MAYFLFIDESGHDRKASPYEVLAGVSIHDEDLWNLINALHDAEIRNFGRRYSQNSRELKASNLLTTKVFRQSELNTAVQDQDIVHLAKAALDCGANAQVQNLKALALAKLNYVREVLDICNRFRCKAFASIVETDAHATESNGLRKDYAYLFERFYYFLDDQKMREQGILVFDEIEKSQSHILIGQAYEYFKFSATGRLRSNLVIPEPFFVHSDLTTGIQIADLIAYIISWGFRLPKMKKPKRPELEPFANQVAALRNLSERQRQNRDDFKVWSFAHITDLRTSQEREDAI